MRAKIICVGNLVIGGSGKTPFAIALAQELIRRKYKIAFISRGYGGSLSKRVPLKVCPTQHSAAEVGDEPLLLAQTAPTYIGANRLYSAQQAQADGAEVIIMDDGLQNPFLFKDINIVIMNGEYGFGNGLLIPAGPLREPSFHAIPRLDFVASYHKKIKLSNIQCFEVSTNSTISLRDKSCIALAGIANPLRFLKEIRKHGISVKQEFLFPDHHSYSYEEIAEIIETAKRLKLKIVTTSKDFVRLPAGVDKSFFRVLGINALLPHKLLKAIEGKLNT